MRLTSLTVIATLCLPALVSAQQVVSARAGLIHHIEGAVTVDGRPAQPVDATRLFGQMPEVGPGKVLRTALGRAEVLMSPGVVLRAGEHSAFRMVSNALEDTRLDLLEGSIEIEVNYLDDLTVLAVRYGDAVVTPSKKGLYRIDTDPARLRVWDGEAVVATAGRAVKVKKGRLLPLDGSTEVAKFDRDVGDSLHRWSLRRAGYLARANEDSAMSLRSRRVRWNQPGWAWNPAYGMFTFIPTRGFSSPFGFRYYSPGDVGQSVFAGGSPYSASRQDPDMVPRTYDSSSQSQATVNVIPSPGASSAPAASAPEPVVRSAETGAERNAGGSGGRR